MLDVALLEAAEFVSALEDTGSLSALARRRGERQSTLSKRLRAFEDRVGASNT